MGCTIYVVETKVLISCTVTAELICVFVFMYAKNRFKSKQLLFNCCSDLSGEIGRHLHYANMSMQYTSIFHGCKNDNFHMKNFDVFLIFAQNIDCGYTLEPPH